MNLELIDSHKIFLGQQNRYRHHSEATQSEMSFSLFLPSTSQSNTVPLVWWLSGLTCNDQNFVFKAGAQQAAERLGLAIICPDTCPRDVNIPGEDDAWDFGSGAGFYVDAIMQPWSKHYRMYSYIAHELPSVLQNHFPQFDFDRQAISGHSMGGHGALTIGLKHSNIFSSISAFAPICAPMQCPWGQKAFSHYLGEDSAQWQEYDTFELLSSWPESKELLPILIDQGDQDEFLESQLNFTKLQALTTNHPDKIEMRLQPGYDHSYFFIASFIEEHLEFHSRNLGV